MSLVDDARAARVSSGRVYGWKDIGAAIGVGEDAAQKRYHWEVPLPVHYGHRGPFAYVSELLDWEDKQQRLFQEHLDRVGRPSRAKPRTRHPAAENGE